MKNNPSARFCIESCRLATRGMLQHLPSWLLPEVEGYVSDDQLTQREASVAVASSQTIAGAKIKLVAALRQKQQPANAEHDVSNAVLLI